MQRLSQVSKSIYQVSRGKYDNFGKILYLNGLLLVNISFGMAATQIVPEIADKMGYTSLGQIIVFLSYLVSMIANIIAPSYLKRFSYRWAFFILASSGVMQCFSGLYISYANKLGLSQIWTYFGCILSAMITGIFYGGLWVAQNLYISENCNDNNKALFFGVSNSLSNSAGFVGSLVSYFLIAPLGDVNYFTVLLILSVLTQLLYLFVLEPPARIDPVEDVKHTIELKQQLLSNIESEGSNMVFRDTYSIPEKVAVNKNIQGNAVDGVVYRPQSVSVSFSPINTEPINSVIQEVQQRKQQLIKENKQNEVVEIFHELPIKIQLTQMWEVAISDKIRPLLPYMVATGVVLGFEYGVYYKIVALSIETTFDVSAEDPMVQTKSFLVFGLQGLSEIFGGLSIGQLGQMYLINYSSIIQSSWIHLVALIVLANCYLLQFKVCIAFGILLGFADCAGQANCMSLLSEDWGDDVRVFGLYNCLQNIGALMAILISIVMGTTPFEYYMLIFIAWMMFSNVCMQYYRRTRRVVEYKQL